MKFAAQDLVLPLGVSPPKGGWAMKLERRRPSVAEEKAKRSLTDLLSEIVISTKPA